MLDSTSRGEISEVLDTLATAVEDCCHKAGLYWAARRAENIGAQELSDLISSARQIFLSLMSCHNSLAAHLERACGDVDPPVTDEALLEVLQAIKSLGLRDEATRGLAYMHAGSLLRLRIEPSELISTLDKIDDMRYHSDDEGTDDISSQDDGIAVSFYDHLTKIVAMAHDARDTLSADSVNAETLRESLKPIIVELLALVTMSGKLQERVSAGSN